MLTMYYYYYYYYYYSAFTFSGLYFDTNLHTRVLWAFCVFLNCIYVSVNELTWLPSRLYSIFCRTLFVNMVALRSNFALLDA